MKDWRGTEIKVGSIVIFVTGSDSPNLHEGKVLGFHEPGEEFGKSQWMDLEVIRERPPGRAGRKTRIRRVDRVTVVG